MLNYYGKFLRNMADLLDPLHELLKKSKRGHWSLDCEKSSKESKKRLMSSEFILMQLKISILLVTFLNMEW